MHKKIVFISWAPYCSRSENIAREFGGKSYMVYSAFLGSNFITILLKYFLQTIKSLWILFRDRPEIVFVMTPPVVACLPVLIYCGILPGTGYIIDAHSGALIDSVWKKLTFVHRFFSKRALSTIVTNEYLREKIMKWNVSSTIVPDVPIVYPELNYDMLKKRQKITAVVVNTFAFDEPLDEIMKATTFFKDSVNFYITGNLKDGKNEHGKIQYENVEFTGFLPEDKYKELLIRSNFVMSLTTCDNTMQRGGYEAIYCERPLITSDWKILKKNFNLGAVFVDNTVESIKKGIEEITKNIEFYEKGARQLREDKLNRWEESKKELRKIIEDVN